MSTGSKNLARARPRGARGRPARLSRDQILDAALAELSLTPNGKLTMTGLARSMGIAPMSLYTHVESRDDLLHGLANRVLSSLDLGVDEATPWREGVRKWVQAVRNHLIDYQPVVTLLGTGIDVSPDWLRIQASLTRILRNAGLTGTDLADASRWIAQTTIGGVLFTIAMQDEDAPGREAAATRASLHDLHASDREEIEALLPFVEGRGADSLFEFSVERILDAVGALMR